VTTFAGRHGIAERTEESHLAPIIMRYVVTSKLWHPSWDQYMMILFHLGGEPGWDPALVVVPGATHAISALTLDPAFGPYQGDEDFSYMLPINFEVQFSCESDDQAAMVLGECTWRVINGEINPESGNAPEATALAWARCVAEVLEGI
jgi:hypothetical protein